MSEQTFRVDANLNGYQLLAASLERLTADPAGAALFAGRIWMRTDTSEIRFTPDGAAIIAVPATGVVSVAALPAAAPANSGTFYYRTGDNTMHWSDGTAFHNLSDYMTANSTHVLTNKTFDANAAGNVLSNVEVADFAAAAVSTDGTLAAANDTSFPSALAVRTYVDDANFWTNIGDIDPGVTPTLPAGEDGHVLWVITNAGTISGIAVNPGDRLVCRVDATAANTPANWTHIPAPSAAPAASETVSGVSEQATLAETIAKTDTTRHIVPAGLVSFERVFTQPIAASLGATVPAATHGLGTGVKDVAVYEGNRLVVAQIDALANGDVTWAVNTAITGTLRISG